MLADDTSTEGSSSDPVASSADEVGPEAASIGPNTDGRDAGSASRQPIYRDFLLIQLAVLVFFLDQFSKYLVREFLPLYHSWPFEGFFRITHTFNTGSIFGLFQGHNPAFILVSFLGVAVLMLIYRSQRFPTGPLRLSLGLQLGGAFGNLIDRVRLGHVTDWIDVSVWPVFNVADACIVTGLVILAWLFIVSERKQAVEGAASNSYDFCPICDGEMRALPSYGNGRESWRCSACGVHERVLAIRAEGHRPSNTGQHSSDTPEFWGYSPSENYLPDNGQDVRPADGPRLSSDSPAPAGDTPSGTTEARLEPPAT